jgi:threonine/homoserine/homoserine lactone efflux protein
MGVLAAIFATAFGVGLSGAVAPGPVLAATIKGVAKSGFWFGPLVIVGHAILEMPVVFGLGVGLGDFLTKRLVLTVISLVGGTVLVLMAVGMLREARTALLPLRGISTINAPCEKRQALWTGITMSISNPYWFLWWATAGIALIGWANKLAATRGLIPGIGLASFYFGHILADLSWYACVAVTVATGRRFFTDKAYRTLIALCGVFLVGLGLFFVYSGVASFFSRGPIVKQLEGPATASSISANDSSARLGTHRRIAEIIGVGDSLKNGDAAALLENGDVRLSGLRPLLSISMIDDDSENMNPLRPCIFDRENRVIERSQPRPRHDDSRQLHLPNHVRHEIFLPNRYHQSSDPFDNEELVLFAESFVGGHDLLDGDFLRSEPRGGQRGQRHLETNGTDQFQPVVALRRLDEPIHVFCP